MLPTLSYNRAVSYKYKQVKYLYFYNFYNLHVVTMHVVDGDTINADLKNGKGVRY